MSIEATWALVLSIACAYIIGSIPFGLVASKICGTGDPRGKGSGNIGFTNVLRVSGKKAGILTLIGDLGKGFLVAWVGKVLINQEIWVLLIAFAVVAGHIFSVFLFFRGGKGVATALGAVAGLDGTLGLILLGIWVGFVAVFKYSSGGALAAFCFLPIIVFGFSYTGNFQIFSLLVSLLILLRHKENIARLMSGQEGKMRFSSS